MSLIDNGKFSSDDEEDCDYVPETEVDEGEVEIDVKSAAELKAEQIKIESKKAAAKRIFEEMKMDLKVVSKVQKSTTNATPTSSTSCSLEPKNITASVADATCQVKNPAEIVKIEKPSTIVPDLEVKIPSCSTLPVSKPVQTTKAQKPIATIPGLKIESLSSSFSPESRPTNKTSSIDSILKGVNNKKRKSGGARNELNNILGVINKKPKMNILDASKLDWNKFKKDEDIEHDLSNYCKSNSSYVSRMQFLERTDVRQYELEKDVRKKGRSNH